MRQFRLIRFPVLLAAATALALPAVADARTVATPPQRIVAMNLCADQLVLALADRRQIAGLSRNAADPDMSAEAAKARGLRIMGSSAEEVLGIGPDLVVGMPASLRQTFAAIRGKPLRTLDLPPAETLAEIRVLIRRTAHAVGHPARGEAMIARMDRELAAIPRTGGGKVAVYYQRRGFVTGTGTLVDELMTRAGLINLAGRLGKPLLSQVSLEEIVAARPDYLIVESATDRITDQGTEMLHHPALAGIRRISIPQAWTVCGGPAYVRAARGIADQIAR
jgi:iron complex transport system substrate-binding protein